MPGMNDLNSTALDLLQEAREEQADLIRSIFDREPDGTREKALADRIADLARQKEEFEERMRCDRNARKLAGAASSTRCSDDQAKGSLGPIFVLEGHER